MCVYEANESGVTEASPVSTGARTSPLQLGSNLKTLELDRADLDIPSAFSFHSNRSNQMVSLQALAGSARGFFPPGSFYRLLSLHACSGRKLLASHLETCVFLLLFFCHKVTCCDIDRKSHYFPVI